MIKLHTSGGEFSTGNFALTTALMTVGFPWFDAGEPCHNIYTNGARPERNRAGRLTKLGIVRFFLSRKSKDYPELAIETALDSYDGKTTPGEDLDRLLEGAGNVSKSDVRELLGAAYVECARNTMANLKEVKAMPNMVPAHIRLVKEDGYPVTVSENFDRDKAAEWGIDMGGQS